MEPSGLGAGGLLIEQGEPVMVSVNKSELRLGLAFDCLGFRPGIGGLFELHHEMRRISFDLFALLN